MNQVSGQFAQYNDPKWNLIHSPISSLILITKLQSHSTFCKIPPPRYIVRRAENQKGCITNTKTETSTETGVIFNNNNNNNNNNSNNGLLMTE